MPVILQSLPPEALEYGGYFVLLLSVGYLLYRAGSWVGTHLIIPTRDRAFKHLDKVDQHLDQVDTHLSQVNTALTNQVQLTGELKNLCSYMNDTTGELKSLCSNMNETMKANRQLLKTALTDNGHIPDPDHKAADQRTPT